MKTKRRINTEPSKALLLEVAGTDANKAALKEIRKRLKLLDRAIILLCSIALYGPNLNPKQNTAVGAIIKKYTS